MKDMLYGVLGAVFTTTIFACGIVAGLVFSAPHESCAKVHAPIPSHEGGR